MQLGKAHVVGVLDHQRVGVGDVDTRFNDGGADQHVCLAVHHGLHHGGEFMLSHLAVAGDNAHLRPQQFLNTGSRQVNGLHTVVEIVDLTTAGQFLPHGVFNDAPVMLQHIGLHRLTVGGRLLKGAHVPQAGEGHVQRAGDRGSRQGQHIHLTAHFLQPLLVGHAEALLLIDDQQAQILELHAFLQQFVGADQHVHAAVSHPVQNPLALLGTGEAGEYFDFDREVLETAHGGGIVLAGQHRSRHKDGRLLAVQNTLHHGTEGHFRFAVAHVATQQAIHGAGPLHILFKVMDGPQLIVRLRVGKGLLKLHLPRGVRREGITGPLLPLGVQSDQSLGQILGGLLGPDLLLGPFRSAQFIQLCPLLLLTTADVLAHLIQLRGRHIQAVAAGVVNFNIVLLHTVHGHPLNTRKAADAVVHMHHQISGRQIRIGLDLLPVGVLLQPRLLSGRRGGQLAFRQNRQFQDRPLTACRQSAQRDPHLTVAGHSCIAEIQRSGDAPILQHSVQVPGAVLTGAQHQHSAAAAAVMLQIGYRRLKAAAVGTQLPRRHGQQPPRLHGVAGSGEGVRHQHREILQRGVQFLGGEGQGSKLACQQTALHQNLRILPVLQEETLCPFIHTAALAEDHHRIGRQVMNRRGHFGIDRRKIPVHAAGVGAVLQLLAVLPQSCGNGFRLLLLGQFVRQLQQPLTQSCRTALGAVGQDFRRRQQQGGLHIGGAPLGAGVEGAHGVDLIIKEFTADGLLHQGRKHIQNAAAQGKLTHTFHLLAAGVSRRQQTLGQVFQIHPSADLQRYRQRFQQLRRERALHQGVRRGHNSSHLAPAQGIQRRKAAPLPIAGGDGPRPQLPLAALQQQRLPPRQRPQVARQLANLPLVSADEYRGTLQRIRHRRAHAGALHRLKAGHRRGAAAVLHPLDQFLHLGDGIQLFQKLFHSLYPRQFRFFHARTGAPCPTGTGCA